MTAAGTTVTGSTVQEQLDAIAKAYGYEGSTDEFLNLLYQTTDAQGAAGNKLTLQTLLYNRIADTQGTAKGDLTSIPVPDAAATAGDPFSFETVGRYFDGTSVSFDGDSGHFAGINGQATVSTVNLELSKLGGNFADISIDFSDISMFDNKGTSTLGATSGDEDGIGSGRRLGDMIGVSIDKTGMIYASYDNGMTRLLGQIATAAFANASGLEKQGDNLYSATLNSGEFDGIGVDVSANGGYMSTGQLEMSNVDLSSEFTEMITTQRGFQANSRIITVSDTLLEELTNLKR